ncbi:FeoA family protein [Paraurantiacibacter namhicola]|uniref:FeoA domain protein n=1 Tax=Paraurantiacibacter namhicola TaxID=645517 RepID=A0A1C7D6T9_9SPHN|nr:FeoA family protein [Paraurantiacibacter namhicola]ANU07180.1 FeoA domain protein [Paraurantiacibacter namhicola]
MTLDELAPRERAEITQVDWASLPESDAKRLRALGVDAGARIAIAHRGVFGGRDPLALMIGRMVIAVRRSHARAISVEHV